MSTRKIDANLVGTIKDEFAIGDVKLTSDPTTLKLQPDKFFYDGLGSLGEMYSLGAVSTDFVFDYAAHGMRQHVILDTSRVYVITSANRPHNGLHQMAVANASGADLTPTWGSRYDFGAAGPPTIPDGEVCLITGLWDSVNVIMYCTHNCAAPSTVLHHRRDDLVAAGGETVLTTTQDIYEDAISIHRDGLLVGVSGYTMTGGRIATLGSATTASEVVSVGFWSETPVVSPSVFISALAYTGALTDAPLGGPVGGSITLSGGDGTYTVDASPVSGTRPPGNGLALVGAVYSDSSGVTTTVGSYSWTDRFHSGDGQSLDVPSSMDVANSDPYWANVVALLHFDGTNGGTSFPDETGRIWTPNTGVTTSTVQQKFGTASALFNGSTGYLDAASSLDFAFGTGDFTIEFFMYGGTGLNAYVIDIGSNGIALVISTGPKIFAYTSGTGISGALYTGVTFSNYAWTHAALVRNGSSLSLYVNGVLGATQTTSQNFNTAVAPHIGRYGGGGATRYAGYIDELRITKGVARYTAAFTPPTAPFPNS